MVHRMTPLLVLGLFTGVALGEVAAPTTQPKPKIEVCFVLDTTGSMSGLIEGAKQKIWSIANTIIAVKDKPEIKIGLIGYRDRGDAYITKTFDLTDDIDIVFKNLQDFSADGGGDGPESVNQALAESISKMTWDKNEKTTRIIFLVGDAPPHMDYKDDVKYDTTCKLARELGIRINTVQCGKQGETTPIWQEIAKLANGYYIPLGQTGDIVAIKTPHDEELAKLNADLGKTLVAYGDEGGAAQQRLTGMSIRSKQALAESAPASVTADRLAFNRAAGKSVQGEGELLDALRDGKVKLDDLKDDQLPEEMRKMTSEQRKAYLDEKKKERDAILAKIDQLSKKRAEYIEAEKKKQLAEAAGKKDSFDEKVAEVVESQRKK